VGVPTSKRSQIDDVQYPRILSRILKGVRMKMSSVVVETNDGEAGEITLILNIWSVETSRYPA
jgi:hypothetical protein